MQEIFDRENDDRTSQNQSYVQSGEYDESEPAGKSCKHCGCEIPSESAVCPECGRWWTNSVS